MSELTERIDDAVRRSLAAAKVVRDLEQHLVTEQAEALWSPAEHEIDRRERSDATGGPQSGANGDVGHSDPTPAMAARIGFYARQQRNLIDAAAGIHRSLDHLERVATSIVRVPPGEQQVDDARCPGWNVELQARLGGCGKVPERYKRADGTTGDLALCVGCRQAEYRARKRDEAERLAG